MAKTTVCFGHKQTLAHGREKTRSQAKRKYIFLARMEVKGVRGPQDFKKYAGRPEPKMLRATAVMELSQMAVSASVS